MTLTCAHVITIDSLTHGSLKSCIARFYCLLTAAAFIRLVNNAVSRAVCSVCCCHTHCLLL